MLVLPFAGYKVLSAQGFPNATRQLSTVAAALNKLSAQAGLTPGKASSPLADQQQLAYPMPPGQSQQQQQQPACLPVSMAQQQDSLAAIKPRPCSTHEAHGVAAGPASMDRSNAAPCSSVADSLNSGDRTSRGASPACAGTKSAKRKAAEALLAAQYGSIHRGSSTFYNTSAAFYAAASQGHCMHVAAYGAATTAAGPAADAASDLETVSQQHNKRQRSSLAAAIDKLDRDATTFAPSAGAAAAAEQQRGPPELTGLGAALTALHSQHRAMVQSAAAAAGSFSSGMKQQGQGPVAAASLALAAGALPVEQQQEPLLLQQQQNVVVPACDSACSHAHTQGWCHSQVELPHVDWGRILDVDLNITPSYKMAHGYERLQLPSGVQVVLVENHLHLPAALSQLRAHMQDNVVAIDLEWRPEFGRGFTPVAMVQLASSKMAVLVRTCRMGYQLPPALKAFLRDPKVHLLGFSWAMCDEGKMQSTFGVGSKDFGRFTDLQLVAAGLGYHGFGLARLTRQVLGLAMPKSKKISMSNWEIANLSRAQMKYAALDVLMAGQVFRALRLWHSSPSLCEVCHHNLGAASSSNNFTCGCGRSFIDIKAYQQHCERNKHEATWDVCKGCGCARPLPWPSSTGGQQGGGQGMGSDAGSN